MSIDNQISLFSPRLRYMEKQTSAVLEFYFCISISIIYHRSRHVILHQSAKFRPYGTAHGRKMTSCRFSRWRISAILDFRGPNPIMGSLKSPRTTCYRSSIDTIAHSLVFEQIAFLYFGDRQTDKQTDEQTDSLVA